MSSETGWHRHWKPGLRGKTWQTFVIDDNTYLLKSYFHDGSYSFLLSDCTSMWYENIDREDMAKRFKKLNPSVEAPLVKLLDHIQEQVDEQKKGTEYAVRFKGPDDATTVQLTITSKLAGLPFTWKFIGSPADKEMVAQHLTMPLFVMVGELERRQKALYKVLTAKDREVEDLRAQGVRPSRRHLETSPFDETVFVNNMDTCKEFENQVATFGRGSLTETAQTLYGRIMAKDAWLHREVDEDVTGDSLMAEDGESDDVRSRSVPGQSWTNRLPPSIAQSSTASQPTASKSPKSSPTKSPQKGKKSAEPSPDKKDTELLRRQLLEKRLQDEEAKQDQKAKKKKMKF